MTPYIPAPCCFTRHFPEISGVRLIFSGFARNTVTTIKNYLLYSQANYEPGVFPEFVPFKNQLHMVFTLNGECIMVSPMMRAMDI